MEAGHVEKWLLRERMIDKGDVVLIIVIVQLGLGLVDVNIITSGVHTVPINNILAQVGLDVPQLYWCRHLI